MPNNTPRLFVLFLSVFSILGVALFYGGVGRLKATDTPPFSSEGHMYHVYSSLPEPPDRLLVRLEMTGWRVVIWLLAFTIPITVAYLAYGSHRPVFGYGLLLFWSAFTGFFGIWTWLFSVFHSLPL
ncbi:MAG TPA: hypothetical protein VK633_03285 [Verrucomicrobiae bacterium]|nr:hypothetical protein [Verrucomicrobiae bacterium]